MDKSPNLALSYLAAAQAQKHVTVNETTRVLDAVVQISVLDRNVTSPPTSVNDGDRYLVAAPATGAWAGQEGQIAAYQDGAWVFFIPRTGWLVWIADETTLVAWDGSAWVGVGGDAINPAALVGVNTTADSSNRLAVKSDATLFSHDDVTPGSGDMRQVLNKASAGHTVSQLYQSNWSGRAETGLTGDDDWHVKVSPDGSAWHEALIVDKDNGGIQLPAGLRHIASQQRPQGFLAAPSGPSIYRIDALRSPSPRTATIDSVSGDVITLTTATSNQFFANSVVGRAMFRLWNTSRSPIESAWIIDFPSSTTLQVLDTSSIAAWSNGDTIQIGDPPSVTPGNVVACDISPGMMQEFGTIFRQEGVLAKWFASGDSGAMTALEQTQIRLTPTGMSGSYVNGRSGGQGLTNEGLFFVACTEPSPVSNSNLVFVREEGPADALTIQLAAVVGYVVGL